MEQQVILSTLPGLQIFLKSFGGISICCAVVGGRRCPFFACGDVADSLTVCICGNHMDEAVEYTGDTWACTGAMEAERCVRKSNPELWGLSPLDSDEEVSSDEDSSSSTSSASSSSSESTCSTTVGVVTRARCGCSNKKRKVASTVNGEAEYELSE